MWRVRLRFHESLLSEGRKWGEGEREKEKEKCVKRKDFTLYSTIKCYGLACDGEGEESSFELTL